MMLKNKPKTLGQFIIDLTPLLDVIFILLIVVLSFQDNYSKLADEKLENAEKIEQTAKDAMAENNDHYETVQKQLETYEQMYDYVNVVTVFASYRPSNRKYRTLHVEINAREQWEREINPSNEDKIWDECRAYIEGVIGSNENKPTIFAIKDEKMLYRDEQAILSLYEDLNIKDKFEKNYSESDDE
jgi:hypothetical protein